MNNKYEFVRSVKYADQPEVCKYVHGMTLTRYMCKCPHYVCVLCSRSDPCFVKFFHHLRWLELKSHCGLETSICRANNRMHKIASNITGALGLPWLPNSMSLGSSSLPNSMSLGSSSLPNSMSLGSSSLPNSMSLGLSSLGSSSLPNSISLCSDSSSLLGRLRMNVINH